ncbi:MAG: AtpZ/AtpI family protein [Syntrophales bacterium]|jgi:ATP synthase protein I|nr:AtpZ/AtpI family protein [Syntrophales bacterium]MCK9391958.1 AtpZ/AtpI family protein [Syntrophales bacterium]
MNEEHLTPIERLRRQAEDFTKKVSAKEARKIKGKFQKDEGIWFGLGVVGIVGWSVVIPTLIGTAIGLWIDGAWPSRFSWTLMLLILGVALGCLNAWYWVNKARETIIKD